MEIGATQYSLQERSFDIFLNGCAAPHCPGCHNPQLWEFNQGNSKDSYDIVESLETSINMVDKIRIMGGEPFDQPVEDLGRLLSLLNACFPLKQIWIFTRYHYGDLGEKRQQLLRYVDYVKHGEYQADKPPYYCPYTGIELASNNQYVQKYISRQRLSWLKASH